MNLTSPSQVKAWCIENGFHPNKVLGQNFLIDQNALKAIVDAGLEKAEEKRTGVGNRGGGEPTGCGDGVRQVLEIGPGLGVLTEELLKRGCAVTAIEKDPVLAERLVREARARAAEEPWWRNLTVIADDALAWIAKGRNEKEKTGAENRCSSPFSAMVSNLPYQAGTRILLDLVAAHEIPAMTVLVQTEVAERLAAGPGSKTRSLAGVWAQLDYDVKVIRKVSASCFWPRPEIGSSVVRLVRHDRNAALSSAERKMFHGLTKQAFEHRRKQLGSIFRNLIASTARAEELSNEDWVCLAKSLAERTRDPILRVDGVF